MDACTPHARFIERLCGRIREETRRLCFIKKEVEEKSPKVKHWNSFYIRTKVCLVQPGKSLMHPILPIGFPESPWVICTSLRFRYDISPSSSTDGNSGKLRLGIKHPQFTVMLLGTRASHRNCQILIPRLSQQLATTGL